MHTADERGPEDDGGPGYWICSVANVRAMLVIIA